MPYSTSALHRPVQQQPQRTVDRQQQQTSGSGEFQPRRQQMGGGQPATPGQSGQPTGRPRRLQGC